MLQNYLRQHAMDKEDTNMMEFMDGVKKKETLGISQILEGDYTG